MNKVMLIGNLTKDPEVRYSDSQTAVCNFSVALNRGKDKNGEDLGADFPRCIAFGKIAENMQKYLGKGSKVGIEGRLRTGSYQNQKGDTVYTTDIVVSSLEFLSKSSGSEAGYRAENGSGYSNGPQGEFEAINDDDVPF